MNSAMALTAVLVGTVALVVLWKLSRRKKPKPWMQATTCPQCGWTGQTSRYAGRCPKCNNLIGDQKGKRVRGGQTSA